MMRQGPGCPGSRSNRRSRGKSPSCEHPLHIGEQGFLAAEEMRHSSNIHKDPIGRIDCTPRTPPPRPNSKPFQAIGISRWIERSNRQILAKRAGICQNHARLQADPQGRRIYSADA